MHCNTWNLKLPAKGFHSGKITYKGRKTHHYALKEILLGGEKKTPLNYFLRTSISQQCGPKELKSRCKRMHTTIKFATRDPGEIEKGNLCPRNIHDKYPVRETWIFENARIVSAAIKRIKPISARISAIKTSAEIFGNFPEDARPCFWFENNDLSLSSNRLRDERSRKCEAKTRIAAPLYKHRNTTTQAHGQIGCFLFIAKKT